MSLPESVPAVLNEPILGYLPNSKERAELKARLLSMAAERPTITPLIDGKSVETGNTFTVSMPHRHRHIVADVHAATPAHMTQAIEGAMKAKRDWSLMPFRQRAGIFLRAAEMLATTSRARINAATMLGQSKTVFQAEIDAACESIDFLRFNVKFAEQIMGLQPASSSGMWNSLEARPLDGFVLAVAPFNFTAISLNLAAAPALMGNVVILKPAETASLSAWHLNSILREAGLPDGVIQFVPGDGAALGPVALNHPDLGGVHFTGSTTVFQKMWKTVGDNMGRYKQYPRLVGETGGKDFVFVHSSASSDSELDAIATAVVRAGFEYQGQKCSACSRVFAPQSLWPKIKERIVAMTKALRQGDVSDFRNFVSAVIDERAFSRIVSYQALGKEAGAKTIVGGTADKSEGYFVHPTLIETDSPTHRLMTEEIFGPVVSAFVYPDAGYEEALRACDKAAPYALTGAIFARDRHAIDTAARELRHAAGNFYINDKPTGAVVGQQPFGGSRASGTNDKAGSILNLLRWVSPRTVKETLVPPTSPEYPLMSEA